MIRLIFMNPPFIYIQILFECFTRKRPAGMTERYVPSAVQVVTAQRNEPLAEPEKDFK